MATCDFLKNYTGDMQSYLENEVVLDHIESCEECQHVCKGDIDRLLKQHGDISKLVLAGRNSYLYQAYSYVYPDPFEKVEHLNRFLSLLQQAGLPMPLSHEDLTVLAEKEGTVAEEARRLKDLVEQTTGQRAWKKIATRVRVTIKKKLAADTRIIDNGKTADGKYYWRLVERDGDFELSVGTQARDLQNAKVMMCFGGLRKELMFNAINDEESVARFTLSQAERKELPPDFDFCIGEELRISTKVKNGRAEEYSGI